MFVLGWMYESTLLVGYSAGGVRSRLDARSETIGWGREEAKGEWMRCSMISLLAHSPPSGSRVLLGSGIARLSGTKVG